MPLAIDHWHHAIRLTGPHRAPQAVRDRVEAVARGCGSTLAAALDGYLRARAGEVIRLRSLRFDYVCDTQRNPAQTMRALAAGLARCIVDGIEAGGGDVVRFADEPAYVAAFAVALADGDAHRRWYFDDFDGLAVLPAGIALRTLFEDRPEQAWSLLERLAAHPRTFAVLGEGDALRVLDVLRAQAGDDAPPPPLLLPPVPPSTTPVRTLLVALTQALQRGAAPSRGLLAAVLAESLMRRAPDAAARGAMPQGIEVHDTGRDALAERLAELGEAGRLAWRDAQQRQPRARPAADPPAATEAPLFDAPCTAAGLVILLGELDDLLPEDVDARGSFALATLAVAAGLELADAVWNDAAWRALLDVAPAMDGLEFAQSLPDPDAACRDAVAAAHDRGVPRLNLIDARALVLPAALAELPPRWRSLLRASAHFAWRRVALRVPGMLGSSLPYLRRNLIADDGHARSDDGAHWQWQCARAPMHVLLSMTSLSNREQAWRGPPARLLQVEFR